MNDPLGLGNFEGSLNAAPAQAVVARRPGLLGSIANTLEQPFKYFGGAGSGLTKVASAGLTHNQQALKNAKNQVNTVTGLGSNNNVGNALKKLVGNSVSLATDFAAPEAKAGVLGRAVQGAKIGAAAGGGTALANNQDVAKGVLEGAATGGVTGGVLGGLTGGGRAIKGAVGNASQKVTDNEEAQKAFQNVVPFRGVNPKALSENNLGGSMELLKSFGMDQTPQSMHTAADLATGQNGIISGTMRQILADAPKINTNGVLDDADKALVKEGGQLGTTAVRENTPAKNILSSLRQEFQSTLFKGEGSLNGKADANDVLDTIQNLEGRIRTLNTDGIDGAERRVLQATKNSLQDKLFNNPEVHDTVNNFKLAPEDVNRLHSESISKGATPSLVNHIVNGINDASRGQDLRSLQRPFVQMSNLADEADKVAAGKGVISSATDAARAASQGSGYNPATRDIYYSLQNPAMLPFLAGDVIKGGRGSSALAKLSPTVNKTANVLKPSSLVGKRAPALAAQGVAGEIGQSTPDNSQPATLTDNNASTAPTTTPTDTSSEGGISQQQLLALVAADPKNASTYIALYNAVKAPTTSTGPKQTAQNLNNAQSGLAALQNLAGLIQSNPNVVRNASTPGQKLPIVGGYITNATGAGSYEDIANTVMDSLARLKSGAALNKDEIKLYQGYLPKAGDSQETINTKIQQLESIFNSVLQ